MNRWCRLFFTMSSSFFFLSCVEKEEPSPEVIRLFDAEQDSKAALYHREFKYLMLSEISVPRHLDDDLRGFLDEERLELILGRQIGLFILQRENKYYRLSLFGDGSASFSVLKKEGGVFTRASSSSRVKVKDDLYQFLSKEGQKAQEERG